MLLLKYKSGLYYVDMVDVGFCVIKKRVLSYVSRVSGNFFSTTNEKRT